MALDDRERQQDFNCKRSGWTWQFYKSRNWAVLWDEFLTANRNNGHLKHRTAWQFCREKTKSQKECELMFEMIGPRPILEPGQRLRAPWLGDWQRLRANTFSNLSDPALLLSVKRAIKERANQLDALRALAPLSVRWMQRAERLAGKVQEAFAGEPFSQKWPPDHPKNIKRCRLYISLLKEAYHLHIKACEAWMRAHGINPDDPSQWAMTTQTDVPVKAMAPGYQVAACVPSKPILLQRVTPGPIQPAHDTMARRKEHDRLASKFALSEQKPEMEDRTQRRKPHTVQGPIQQDSEG
jgi:hypothetical protein